MVACDWLWLCGIAHRLVYWLHILVLLPSAFCAVHWIKNVKCEKFCVPSEQGSARDGSFSCRLSTVVFANYLPLNQRKKKEFIILFSLRFLPVPDCHWWCGKPPSFRCLCAIFTIYKIIKSNNNGETVKCVWKKHQKVFHWIKRCLQRCRLSESSAQTPPVVYAVNDDGTRFPLFTWKFSIY